MTIMKKERKELAEEGKSVSVVPSADVREPALMLVVAVYWKKKSVG